MSLSLDDAFAELPVVAILRGIRPDEVLAVAEALVEAGVRIVEVPLNSPEPLESIRRLGTLSKVLAHGAGTVLSVAAVEEVARAGGRICVSPDSRPEVITAALAHGLAPLPGFSTASEALRAYDAGARRLKLFPASSHRPSHVKALKDVLSIDACVIAVGGVEVDAMADWWAAGARGFGVGGDLYRPGVGPAEVRERAAAVVAAVRRLKG